MRVALALTALLFATAAHAGDPMVNVGWDDPAMNAAISEARENLPYFLEMAREADLFQGNFLVKRAVAVPGDTYEHIWVTVKAVSADTVEGFYANNANDFDARVGDHVTVPMDEISDWSFYGEDGLLKGNYTTRVLLPEMKPANAKRLKAMLSPCPAESC